VREHVPSLAVLNVCVGAIAARALRALAHGINRVRSGAFLHGALLAFREHTCVSLCLMAVIFPRAFPQSRAAADQYASLHSTPARFTATRLPNPEAPSWAASHERSACDSPFALSFGPHTPHAIPLILPACCGLLHACVETLQATFELAAALGPTYLHAAEYTRLLFAG